MKVKNSQIFPFLCLQLAVLLFGFSGVISRMVSVSPYALTCGRVLCSVVILYAILRQRGEKLASHSRIDSLVVTIAGLLLALHWTSFFQSIQLASVAIGTITFSTFPLFLIFLEPMVYKEAFSWKNGVLALLLLIGAIITVPSFSLENQMTLGLIWGMVSSLSYALLALCNRRLATHYSGMWISFREQVVVAVCLLPSLWLTPISFTVQNLAGILLLGLICTAVAFSLFVTSQKYLSSQIVSLASGMETVYGILLAFLCLGEAPSFREILGGTIIVCVASLTAFIKK